MGNLEGFMPANHVTVPIPTLPAGEYDVIVSASEKKLSQAGNEMLQIELTITDGEFRGRRLWDYLPIGHGNKKARDIALARLADLCRAVGVLTPSDTSELHDLPLTVRVNLRETNGYGLQPAVGRYYAREMPFFSEE